MSAARPWKGAEPLPYVDLFGLLRRYALLQPLAGLRQRPERIGHLLPVPNADALQVVHCAGLGRDGAFGRGGAGQR